MKTPDESKCGMECIRTNVERLCIKPEKGQCPRCKQLVDESLAYIQQLESRLAQVERERDAAVSDINFYQSAVCFTCSNHIPPEEREDWRIYCKKYGRLPEVISDKRPTFCSGYNWRGVCEENTKEE